MGKFESVIGLDHEVVVLGTQAYESVVEFESWREYFGVECQQQAVWEGSLIVLLEWSYWYLVVWLFLYCSPFSKYEGFQGFDG